MNREMRAKSTYSRDLSKLYNDTMTSYYNRKRQASVGFRRNYNNVYQSPKITSAKTREPINQQKLFSMRDINDKITNSRGINIPIVFKRLTDEEINKLYKVDFKKGWNYDKIIMKAIKENTQKLKRINKLKIKIKKEAPEEENKVQVIDNENHSVKQTPNTDNNIKKNRSNNLKIKTDIDINTQEIKDSENNENKSENPKFMSLFAEVSKENNDERTKKDNDGKNKKLKLKLDDFELNTLKENINSDIKFKTCQNFLSKRHKSDTELNDYKHKNKNYGLTASEWTKKTVAKNAASSRANTSINRNDIWMPKGYKEYEAFVKNPNLMKKKLAEDPFAGKLPNLSLKEIRAKSNNTDPFFLKGPTEKDQEFQKKNVNYPDFQNSDIFNIKNDMENILKMSETHLLKPHKKVNYSITSESNSKWEPRKPDSPSLFNYTSTEYNILNPSKKSFQTTKTKVYIECENKKDNVTKPPSVNYMNPIYRKKSLSEFIDITRNGSSNPGYEFRDFYKNYPDCFRHRVDLCGSFGDSYLYYKDIIDKPFQTQNKFFKNIFN